ncbi:MAG: polysaccharide biosynthesis/export family protein [Planctomycetaceae bacterium]|nr:polysaccharide biosynthesis/export family protein [Planctomycetaceae bacterium]
MVGPSKFLNHLWKAPLGSMCPSRTLVLVAGCLTAISGCSWNQDLGAIPVSRVPSEILQVDQKDDYEDISLLRLRQDPPDVYRLAAGDILGIYVKGILGNDDELPPVHYPEDANRPPAIGYPVPIREDGTLALPIIDPILVEGMNLVEATNAIRQAYRESSVTLEERDQTIVTLFRERKIRVLVIREEAGGVAEVSKRGTGHIVDLPAYENDVLHALSETGGMPGVDAKNEIMIYRGMFADGVNYDNLLNNLCMDNCEDPCFCNEAPLPDPPNVTRIPLRYHPSRPPVFGEEDIILNDGDIIIIRSRDRETFYTAGMLGGGEHQLPRDKDLDIIGAIALAGGPLGNVGSGIGGIGGNRGGGSRGGGGGGYCRPSEAIVMRELPCGSQIAIKIDLNRALANPSERILIQPGDVIMVRYTIAEEIGNVLLNLIQFNFLLNGLSGSGF